MNILQFTYNGRLATYGEYDAPYAVEFIEWTPDEGIFLGKCSDGRFRLIPGGAVTSEDFFKLPKQQRSCADFGLPSSWDCDGFPSLDKARKGIEHYYKVMV